MQKFEYTIILCSTTSIHTDVQPTPDYFPRVSILSVAVCIMHPMFQLDEFPLKYA